MHTTIQHQPATARGSVSVRKAHGALNDVLLIEGSPQSHHFETGVAEFVREICDRNNKFGGSDGVYFIDQSVVPPEAHYFNADGSSAEYCGNGMRCVGRFVLGGGHESEIVQVRSGGADFEISPLPASREGVENVSVRSIGGFPMRTTAATIELDGRPTEFSLWRVPNPHLVAVVDQFDEDALAKAYDELAALPEFADGVNVSLVISAGTNSMDWFVRTYERGAGLTPSCASGAVAAAMTLVHRSLAPTGHGMLIRNHGGPLTVQIDVVGGRYVPTQSGNATYVFQSGVSSSDAQSSAYKYEELVSYESERQQANSLWWLNADHLRRTLGITLADVRDRIKPPTAA